MPLTTYQTDAIQVGGVPIEDLISGRSFIHNLLVSLGVNPDFETTFNALLVAWCDHGEAPPSTQAAIYAASCGVPFAQVLTAAVSCLGVHHCPIMAAGAVIAKLAKKNALRRAVFVSETLANKEKIPGFGHPLHDNDPRIAAVLTVAGKQGIPGVHLDTLWAVEHDLKKHGKKVRANLAGFSAALALDMGFPERVLDLIPVLGRSVGLAAHAVEQASKPPLKLGGSRCDISDSRAPASPTLRK
jgi:citrate synthase